MRFQHIDAAFEVCRKHKKEAIAAGLDSFQVKEVEHYLLRAMVLLIISQYEDYIERLFVKRADKTGDAEIRGLVRKFLDRKFRSPDLGKINEILTSLSKSCCSHFQAEVETNQPQIKAAWDNLMAARHAIAHRANGGSVSLTWMDLEQSYLDSIRVLQALANALGLNNKDLSQL